MESERKDALFHDPYARRLSGERGQAIVDAMPQGRQLAWPMVVRTVLFDDFVLRVVRERGADTVLDLATGLDARPWRLDLPPALRWIDVDLPDMLAYKQSVLGNETPRCRYETRAIDLRDAAAREALFRDVAANSRGTLVLTEGLLIYLDPADVASLARDLAAVPSIRWWVLDIASPALIAWSAKRWGGKLAAGNSPFKFAPAESTHFFEPHGWKETEYRSTWEEARRLKREMPLAWLWRLLGSFAPKRVKDQWLRFSGSVLLERAPGGTA
jgi:methyltransferase (TIGR00027 family)